MIIGLSGKMQSGKNTVASIIQYLIYKDKVKDSSLSLNAFLNNTFIGDSYSGFIQKSFAHKLKKIVSILTGIPVGDLEKQEVKNRVLGEEWDKLQITFSNGFDEVTEIFPINFDFNTYNCAGINS